MYILAHVGLLAYRPNLCICNPNPEQSDLLSHSSLTWNQSRDPLFLRWPPSARRGGDSPSRRRSSSSAGPRPCGRRSPSLPPSARLVRRPSRHPLPAARRGPSQPPVVPPSAHLHRSLTPPLLVAAAAPLGFFAARGVCGSSVRLYLLLARGGAAPLFWICRPPVAACRRRPLPPSSRRAPPPAPVLTAASAPPPTLLQLCLPVMCGSNLGLQVCWGLILGCWRLD